MNGHHNERGRLLRRPQVFSVVIFPYWPFGAPSIDTFKFSAIIQFNSTGYFKPEISIN
jgi:hypothetical protein